jgi:hypothetical protein
VTMYHTYYNQTSNIIGFARVTSTTNAADGAWGFRGCGGTANGMNCTDATLFYAPMTLGPGNPNTLYFGTDRLYRSTNRGDSMFVVSQAPLLANTPISAIGVSRQNDSVRVVGLRNGKVFATSTGSTTLTDVTGSIPAKYIARAIIDPNSQTTAYLALGGYFGAATGHVWKTTTLNSPTPAWSAAAAGIPDVPVNALVIDPANSNNVYAGTDIGVFNSTNGGTSWNAFGTGLPRVAVFDMAIQNPSRILRIATHGRGMWEISLVPATSVAENQFPTTFTLEQSYPNPFNPSTTIRYGLPQGEYVTLEVFNTLGQRVALLVNEKQEAGFHEVTFRDPGLASGAYFYTIKAGEHAASKKLMLLK